MSQHEEPPLKHMWPQTKMNNQHIRMCKNRVNIVNSSRPFMSRALILKAIDPCAKIGTGHARLQATHEHQLAIPKCNITTMTLNSYISELRYKLLIQAKINFMTV